MTVFVDVNGRLQIADHGMELERENIQTLVQEIGADKPIAIRGHTLSRALEVKSLLLKAGFKNVSIAY